MAVSEYAVPGSELSSCAVGDPCGVTVDQRECNSHSCAPGLIECKVCERAGSGGAFSMVLADESVGSMEQLHCALRRRYAPFFKQRFESDHHGQATLFGIARRSTYTKRPINAATLQSSSPVAKSRASPIASSPRGPIGVDALVDAAVALRYSEHPAVEAHLLTTQKRTREVAVLGANGGMLCKDPTVEV